MREARRTFASVWGTTLAFAMLAGACGGAAQRGAPLPPPPAPPAAPAIASAKTAAPAAPKDVGTVLKEVAFGSTKVRIEECAFDRVLTSPSDDPIKAIARAGDKLYVANGSDAVAMYTIKPGCTLASAGSVKLDAKIEGLSADGKGTVYASNGVFDAYRIRDGKVAGKCANHYFAAAPDGATGYTFFVSATVAKVAIGKDACTTTDWALQNMNDAAKRKGTFTGVTAIGFMDGNVVVGGSAVEPKDARKVVVLDPSGAEKLRFGNPDGSKQDGFGWVHAVSACGAGICVADANFKAISLWTKTGTFIGRVSLDDAMKTDRPWAQTLATTDDGSLLVGVAARGTPNTGRVLRFVFGG